MNSDKSSADSTKEKELLSIIETIRTSGNLKAIPALIKMMEKVDNEDIQNTIANMLFDIKDPGIIPSIIEAIGNPGLQNFQRILVSSCWESGLDYSKHIGFFAELATKVDYLTTIECLTVIENMEGPFDQKDLEAAILLTRNAADEGELKFDLLNSIWEVLVDFRE